MNRFDPLLSRRTTEILELPGNRIALSTYGFGVLILKGNKIIERFTTKQGLTTNTCKKLMLNGNDLWVVTNGGVNKVSLTTNPVKITRFQVDKGLTSNEVNDILIYGNSVYLATNEGLTIFPEKQEDRTYPPLKVYISKFVINGKSADPDSIPKLKFRQNNISVQFIALNYNQAERVVYRYRLHPNAPWIKTQNTSVDFSSLEADEYMFELSAKTQNRVWTKPVSVAFQIKPAFWRTWWFLSISIILLSAAISWLLTRYLRQQRLRERQRLITQNRIISLEQQALQAMMNPHFVFNVMNSIQHFINTSEPQAANKVLTGFARLIRKNLDICTKSFIPLEEEIAYLRLYLSLEQLRFGDKMQYHFHLDDSIDLDETIIPSMLLQPFVENAIWHGLMPKEEGGTIDIHLSETEGFLRIRITDDGIGILNSKKLKKTEHISRGMQLTQERINLINKHNPQHIELDIIQTGVSGTEVTIIIPLTLTI